MTMLRIAERNRQRLLENMEDGLLLLKAPPEVYRNSDINYFFRQHSNIYFLTGLSEPEVVLALEKKGKRSRFTLFVHPFNRKQAVWFGNRVGRKEARDIYGAQSSQLLTSFKTALPKLLAGKKHLYLDFGEGSEFAASMLKALGSLSANNREGINYPESVTNAAALLSELRLRKEEDEIQLMQKAADVTGVAFRKALKSLRPGMKENELQAILEHEFKRGSGDWAYGTIVAGGVNGLVLHYIKNCDTLEDGDLVLIDAGAEYQNYSADVTRTWPVNGRFSPAQKQVYQAVLKAQKAAIAIIKPGVTFQEIDRVATQVLVEELVRMKVLKGKPAEIISKKRHVPFYPHGTGHWLGLDTHDVGNVKPQGKERVLEAGMVLTVEPGLYFQQDRRQTSPRLRGIAIRIEDDVLVTPDGHRVLTAAIPKEVAEIEQICAPKLKKAKSK
jgi:Xaa-Pro aminopeptidase